MSIFIAGDIHGCVGDWRNVVAQIPSPDENTVVILAGDVGCEYGNKVMGSLKKEMKKFPGKIIIVRGNHDNRYWVNHTISEYDEAYLCNVITPSAGWELVKIFNTFFLRQRKYPNILYVKDSGCRCIIEDKMFLFIPGAYSVDRYYREAQGMSYEPREQLTKEEMRDIDHMVHLYRNEIDYVVSHTAPYHLQSYFRDLFLDCVNQSQVDNTMEHWLDSISWEMENSDKFKHWYFGHMHGDRKCGDKYTMLYSLVEKID